MLLSWIYEIIFTSVSPLKYDSLNDFQPQVID